MFEQIKEKISLIFKASLRLDLCLAQYIDKLKFRSLCFSLLSFNLLLTSAAATESEQFKNRRMEEVITTGFQMQTLVDMPRSSSVITSDDIDRSGAANIAEVLENLGNVSINSFAGNGKFASIDIRGSGDSSSSNILVLVDGIKINVPDLSGADFSTIPVSQISRIEVINGPNAVRFGSGASHGVINIITKRAPQGGHREFSTRVTSYDGYEANTDLAAVGEAHSIRVNYHYQRSHGYRQHNDFNNQNLLVNYQYDPNENFQFSLKGRNYHDHYELPGPLSIESLSNEGPRHSVYNSRRAGNTSDKSLAGFIRANISDQIEISQTLQHWRRESNFYGVADIDSGEEPDKIKLDSYSSTTAIHWQIVPDSVRFSTGYDFSKNTLSRSNGGYQQRDTTVNNGDNDEDAFFAYLKVDLSEIFSIQGGYRRQSINNAFIKEILEDDENSPSCVFFDTGFGVIRAVPNTCSVKARITEKRNNNWTIEVGEIGANIKLANNLSLYAAVGETFRIPNVDEYVVSPPDLSLQTAERYEAGLKYQGQIFEGSLGLFKSTTKDEIIYRQLPPENPGDTPEPPANLNYPWPITRHGFELSLHLYPSDQLSISLNGGYTHARAEDNRNDSLRIPNVPTWNASLHLGWSLDDWNIDFNLRHTDKKLDGNDIFNTDYRDDNYSLPSQTVSDFRLAYTAIPDVELFLGINNLANEQYEAAGYSRTVYPANPRNYYGGFRASF